MKHLQKALRLTFYPAAFMALWVIIKADTALIWTIIAGMFAIFVLVCWIGELFSKS